MYDQKTNKTGQSYVLIRRPFSRDSEVIPKMLVMYGNMSTYMYLLLDRTTVPGL